MKSAVTQDSFYTLLELLEEVGKLTRRQMILREISGVGAGGKAESLQDLTEAIAKKKAELQAIAALLEDGDEALDYLIFRQVDFTREWREDLMRWFHQRQP